MSRLDEKIEKALLLAKAYSKYAIRDPAYLEKYYAGCEIKKIVEQDFMSKNPSELFDEYWDYFMKKQFPTKKIRKGQRFYRARVGNMLEYGADDDLNEEFVLPYYGNEIIAPPPLLSSVGRFNKAGISYLYLADRIETCMAEVHLQVGQLCSIGVFRCKKGINLIDLNAITNDFEMETWIDILTQPVYGNNQNRYNITNFLSEILQKINDNGLWYKSVQSKGNNIVCYKPDAFEVVSFSEKLYRTKQIRYEPVYVEDSIDKYSKREEVHLSAYNEKIEEQREETVNYMEDWISFRKAEK